MSKVVAIQGIEGSFHQMAAQKYFGRQLKSFLFCQTFIEVFEALKRSQADAAVLAIGNNKYGDINHIYEIIINSHLNNQPLKYWVSGEVYIDISLCLLGLETIGFEDIKEVHSQALAIIQSLDFIRSNLKGTLVIEHDDTALSAQLVANWRDVTKTAIAAKEAAKLYGLKILAENIQDNSNLTRFLVIEPGNPEKIKGANKTSLLVTTDHSVGALTKVLNLFASKSINLDYLQSTPIAGQPFEYLFFADVEAGIDDLKFKQALDELNSLGYSYQILGSYKKSKLP